jgi:hypothetical protein
MADLSGLIYSVALSNPIPHPSDIAGQQACQPDRPWQAGAAARLAPLVALAALSLPTIVLCAHPSHARGTVTSRPAQVNSATALRVPPAEASAANAPRASPR